MITVGIIGFGLSGRTLQAPFFQSSARYKLKSIVTSRAIPQDQFPNVTRLDNYEELLNDSEVNLVSICSPSATHYEIAIKLLEAGKNILIEKPITDSLVEAKAIYELAERKGLKVCVFQNRRFDADFMTVQKVIDSGLLGDIITYEAYYDRYKPILNAKKWKEEAAPANGILYDLGSHIIDQVIVLFGKPTAVNGETFIQRANSQVVDAFELKMKASGVNIRLRSSLMVKEQGPRYIIHGTKGTYTKYGIDLQEDHLTAGLWPGQVGFGIDPIDGQLVTSYKDLELRSSVKTEVGNWMQLFDNLADAIEKGSPMIISKEQIFAQIEIIESIDE
jgi:scyllo-inositol 2-dehydrogenase (NADP+)